MSTERMFIINGVMRRVMVADEQTLADMLRDQLGLTGCKVGCDQALCGACTVLVDGVPVAACSQFAFMAEGTTIETVEGLASRDRFDPVQQAFLEVGAVQCGFCTARADHVGARPAAPGPPIPTTPRSATGWKRMSAAAPATWRS